MRGLKTPKKKNALTKNEGSLHNPGAIAGWAFGLFKMALLDGFKNVGGKKFGSRSGENPAGDGPNTEKGGAGPRTSKPAAKSGRSSYPGHGAQYVGTATWCSEICTKNPTEWWPVLGANSVSERFHGNSDSHGIDRSPKIFLGAFCRDFAGGKRSNGMVAK